jgi:hypothetical protein
MKSLLTIRSCLVLALALPLAACTGTPLGEQLSDSFSQPPAGGALPGDAPGQQTPAPAVPPGKAAATPKPPPVAVPSPQRPVALAPAPYRLVLRLPAADPAAPSEAVTEALRAAGVSFEVETIEREPVANVPAQPSLPPAAPAPVPSTQPAPVPR